MNVTVNEAEVVTPLLGAVMDKACGNAGLKRTAGFTKVPAEKLNTVVAVVELDPLGSVTTTLAAPRVPAGVVAVTFCPLFTVKLVAAIPPIVTAVTLLKERPLMVMSVPPPVGPAAGEILVTVGTSTMLATFTSLPLLIEFVVTTAPKVPGVGAVLRVTVSWVAVALVTVPVPLLLRATVLLAAIVSKPAPVMVSVVALIARLLVL